MSSADAAQQPTEPVIPPGYKVLKEGAASVLLKGNDVFYNEAQVTNRDLSTCILRAFLPMLEKERTEGVLKKQRQNKKQQQKQQQKQANGTEAAPATADDSAVGQQKEADAPAHGEECKDACMEVDEKPAAASAQAPAETKPTTKKPRGAVVLEGLAASGLRSIRYAKEIPGIARIDANDLDPAVCESMARNVEFNGPEVQALVKTTCSDARLIMMQNPLRYDVIDLDPYGTPSMLLDTAVQSVADGGILLITATDMANLCGNNAVACWSNYGCYPVHRPYCHEMALRILLACLETHANRYKRHIVPLLSVSVDFYIRVFVRVYTSPAVVKNSACKLAYLWQSSGCDSWWLQRVGQKKENGNSVKYMPSHGPAVPEFKCPETGSNYLMGGPIWAEPIHDHEFVKGVLQDLERDKPRYAQYAKLKGMLTSVLEELPDVPLYYDLHDVCKTVKCQPPKSETFRSALMHAGYRVSTSHANPLAIKTDAPSEVVWDIVRCWVRDHPVNIKDGNSYAAKILAKEPKLQANFSRVAAAMTKNKRLDGVTRYVQNPAHWGPKSRHGRPPVQHPVSSQQQQGSGKAGAAAKAQQQEQQQEAAAAAEQQQEQQQEAAAGAPAAARGATDVAPEAAAATAGAENVEGPPEKKQRTGA